MKNYRYAIVLSAFLSIISAAGALAAGSEWLTDLDAAKKLATEKDVPILVDFSGSDWCGWCIRLDSEVFSKAAFKKYAEKNIVLLLIDFPQRSKQLKEEKARNKQLAQTYGVNGFPTVLLLDKNGKELARTGYRRGGPKKYVEHIRSLIRNAEK